MYFSLLKITFQNLFNWTAKVNKMIKDNVRNAYLFII